MTTINITLFAKVADFELICISRKGCQITLWIKGCIALSIYYFSNQ